MNFTETIDEETFYSRIYNKSNSYDSVRQAKSAVSNMKFYCKDIHNEDVSNVILELKRQDSIGVLFNFLNDLVEWLEDHFMRVQSS